MPTGNVRPRRAISVRTPGRLGLIATAANWTPGKEPFSACISLSTRGHEAPLTNRASTTGPRSASWQMLRTRLLRTLQAGTLPDAPSCGAGCHVRVADQGAAGQRHGERRDLLARVDAGEAAGVFQHRGDDQGQQRNDGDDPDQAPVADPPGVLIEVLVRSPPPRPAPVIGIIGPAGGVPLFAREEPLTRAHARIPPLPHRRRRAHAPAAPSHARRDAGPGARDCRRRPSAPPAARSAPPAARR